MAEIIWSPRALADLSQIGAYIETDSPIAARRFIEKLIAKVELLGEHPLLGGWIAEDKRRVYREVLQGSYRIIYRVEGDKIFIATVHHGARLLVTDDLN